MGRRGVSDGRVRLQPAARERSSVGGVGDVHGRSRRRTRASRTLTAQWSAKGQNGPHNVEVAVDPANAIPELDETNNRATKTFAGQGRKAQ